MRRVHLEMLSDANTHLREIVPRSDPRKQIRQALPIYRRRIPGQYSSWRSRKGLHPPRFGSRTGAAGISLARLRRQHLHNPTCCARQKNCGSDDRHRGTIEGRGIIAR